jgi:hypothetical protein
VDSHSSYITFEFIDHCERNDIIVYCLPPHSRDTASESAFEWDKGREGMARGPNLFVSFFFLLFRVLRGTHTPSFAHSAPMRAEDFLVYENGGPPPGGLWVFLS